ncbi:ComEC/Rec2 family competence protein [Pseudovibrio sp. SPO723]|uniref:ComEC/Rec2 family competence protein n=1 Tax=Nesiotobacter zosterae TaxID=392721 RepID=UPI0029C54E47|nr:ComEC/Rec2 family competence protein [Pseudovibrio sp. SPO723]MDX5592743.1 ComEC/Rec2 family competence protein [Pseudovibrio sp. SPO723]
MNTDREVYDASNVAEQSGRRSASAGRFAVAFRLDTELEGLGQKKRPGSAKGRNWRGYFAPRYWGAAAFAKALHEDLQRGVAPLWAATFFAAGIWFYFSIPFDPQLWALILCCLGAGAAFVNERRARRTGLVSGMVLIFFAGVSASQLHVAYLVGPQLDRQITAKVTAHVGEVEKVEDGRTRLTLQFLEVSNLSPDEMPRWGRISVRGAVPDLAHGDVVELRARLMPLSGAVYPGGYDYAWNAFFKGLQTSGYALSKVTVVSANAPSSGFNGVPVLRQGVADRILHHLGPSAEGGLAVALLVGDRGFLPEEDREALRMAGLAHLLAISGLHMSLVSALVYFAIRHGLAFFSRVALSGQISHIAAFGALGFASFYLVLSGASVATQRAYIMVLIVIVASLLGRRGLSLRTLGFAALIVLMIAPGNLLQPGFQMSFAAVAALIAVYGAWREVGRNQRRGKRQSRMGALVRGPVLWLLACGATSLIAEFAIGPIAAFHFQKIAPYGLVANLLAMPVFSFVAMPLGILGLMFMPLGAEAPFFWGMGMSLNLILQVAHWVHELSGDMGVIGLVSWLGTFLMVGSVLVFALLPGRFKLLFLLPLSLSAVAFAAYEPPHLLISDNGRTIAFFNVNGEPRVSATREGFVASSFLQAFGVEKRSFSDHRALRDDRTCDAVGCVYIAGLEKPPDQGAGKGQFIRIAVTKELSGLSRDCALADVVVTQLQAPEDCRAPLVLDVAQLTERGSHAIWLKPTPDGLKIARVVAAYGTYRRAFQPAVENWARGLVAAE